MKHRPDDRLSALNLSESPKQAPEFYGLDRIGPFLKMSRRDLFRMAAAAAVAGAGAGGASAQTGLPVGHAHADHIYGLKFSADGSLLVSGSGDHTMKLWRPPQGAHFRTVAETDEVLRLSITPDSSKVAFMMNRSFAVQGLAAQDIIKTASGMVSDVAISPDGRFLAVASHDAAAVQLYSIPEGALFRTLGGEATSVAFSSDGELLAAGGNDGDIRIWSIPEGKLYKTLKGHSSSVNSVVFSPDGRLLGSGGYDKTVRVWSVAGSNALCVMQHPAAVRSVVIAPGGDLVASAGNANDIKLWSIPDGALKATLSGHTADVMQLAISPGGTVLASAGWDRTIRLWSLPGGAPVGPPLTDIEVSSADVKAMQYRVGDDIYTLSPGASLPVGENGQPVTCTCNTVPGKLPAGCTTDSCASYSPCPSDHSCSSYTVVCSVNQRCPGDPTCTTKLSCFTVCPTNTLCPPDTSCVSYSVRVCPGNIRCPGDLSCPVHTDCPTKCTPNLPPICPVQLPN